MPRYRIILRILAALLLFSLAAWNLLLSISAVDRTQEKDLGAIRQKVRQYPWRAESWYILGNIQAVDIRYSSPRTPGAAWSVRSTSIHGTTNTGPLSPIF